MGTPTQSQVYFRMFHTNYNDVFENNPCLTSPINDRGLKCMPKVEYRKMVTGGNDPSITSKTRYSQVIQTSSYCYLRMTVAAAIAAGLLNPDGSLNVNRSGNSGSSGNTAVENGMNKSLQCPMYK